MHLASIHSATASGTESGITSSRRSACPRGPWSEGHDYHAKGYQVLPVQVLVKAHDDSGSPAGLPRSTPSMYDAVRDKIDATVVTPISRGSALPRFPSLSLTSDAMSTR